MKPFRALLALFPLCLASCIEQDEKLTVNPDNTCKFTVKIHLKTGQLRQFQKLSGNSNPEQDARTAMLKVIRGSEGVDVWSEAKYVSDSAENVHVTLSGYARDVTKLKLGSALADDKKPIKREHGIFGPIVSRKEGTKWLLGGTGVYDAKAKPKAVRGKEAADPKISAAVQAAKAEVNTYLALGGGALKELKMSRTFVVAGEIEDAGAYEKSQPNTATASTGMEKLQSYISAAMDDPEAVGKAIESGGKPTDAIKHLDFTKPENVKKVAETLYGKPGNLFLTIKPSKEPLFDFKSEAAEALKDQTAELKALLKEASSSP